MNIAGLRKDHPDIYQMALDNQVAQGNAANDEKLDQDKSSGGFTWANTPEGNDFWVNVSIGHFESRLVKETVAKSLEPKKASVLKVGDRITLKGDLYFPLTDSYYRKSGIYNIEPIEGVPSGVNVKDDKGKNHAWTLENLGLYFTLIEPGLDTQIDQLLEDMSKKPDLKAPDHYDNSKGSLYKVAKERNWNPYIFDVVKRLERGGKKDPLRQEIEKSIFVLQLWLKEMED